ncbi:MAG TPA: serine protease [Myxococcales bacterium]|jgi:S1-C subfamily serine protease
MLASLLAALLVASPPPPVPASPELHLPVSEKGPQTPLQKAIDAASCTGEYADAILALSPRAREFERLPEANYSYCLRNTATYECLYYGPDGRIRKRNVTVTAHGTAFAYREKNDEHFLLTNDHVATWPSVTADENDAAGVPGGCKRVDEQLRLVRDESDDYEPGQVQVTKVASDPALDAAILKTKAKLNLMPYRVGRSALLKSGNVVEVRGFPLGLLQATNFGKVVTAYDHDREKGWEHVDFVTDALLSRGNSGSPVLAVSCRTGELELVGLFHAGYRESPALNAVVGIDQLREFMETLKRTRASRFDDTPLTAEVRAAIATALGHPEVMPFFRLGDRTTRARLDGTAIVFDVLHDAFPSRDSVSLQLRDMPGEGAGILESISVETNTGMRTVKAEAADAETQELAGRLLDIARRQLVRTIVYREAAALAKSSRDASRRATDLLRQLDRSRTEANELIRALSDAGARFPETPLAAAPPLTGPSVAPTMAPATAAAVAAPAPAAAPAPPPQPPPPAPAAPGRTAGGSGPAAKEPEKKTK